MASGIQIIFTDRVWSNLHVWLGVKLQSCCCCCWIDSKPHICKLIDKSNIPCHKYDVRTFSCLPGQRFFASFCPSVSVLYSTYCSHFITCSTSGIVICLLCSRLQMDFHPSPNINDPKKTKGLLTVPCFPLFHMQGSLPVIDNRALFICIASQFIMSSFIVYTGALFGQPFVSLFFFLRPLFWLVGFRIPVVFF